MICEYCKQDNFESINSQIVCLNCGVVYGTDSSPNPQQPYLDSVQLTPQNLFTSVKSNNKKLVLWQVRIRSENNMDRNLSSARIRLKKFLQILGLSEIHLSPILDLYKEILETVSVRGKNTGGVLLGSIYYYLKLKGILKTLKEFSQKTGYSRKEVGFGYSFVYSNLNKKSPEINAPAILDIFLHALSQSQKYHAPILRFYNHVKNLKEILGKGTLATLTACTYYFFNMKGEQYPKKLFVKYSKTTEVTLSSRIDLLYKIQGAGGRLFEDYIQPYL